MNEPEPIDVTQVMEAEGDLMTALREWRDAGAPVVDVLGAISDLIDAKIELATRTAQRR